MSVERASICPVCIARGVWTYRFWKKDTPACNVYSRSRVIVDIKYAVTVQREFTHFFAIVTLKAGSCRSQRPPHPPSIPSSRTSQSTAVRRSGTAR